MAKKRKTLPKDFESLLQQGDMNALKAVFERCDVNARGGYAGQTALAYDLCPDALARWLVTQGADIEARDKRHNTPLQTRVSSRRSSIDILFELGANVNNRNYNENTPLHSAAGAYNATNVDKLILHGADIKAINDEDLNPLEYALVHCSNIDIEAMAEVAAIFLNRNQSVSEQMKNAVIEIGKRFEFHRDNFNKESVDTVSAALDQLYQLFSVTPVAHRKMHKDPSPLVLKSTDWKQQFSELWDLLVPGSGKADSIQGELIRICGRLSDELERNGGINWDSDYNKMADTFVELLKQGEQLSQADLSKVTSIIKNIKATHPDADTRSLAQLAVQWVLKNPIPIPLPPQTYKR